MCAHQRLAPVDAQRVAPVGGAAVLPDERAVERRARVAVPHHGRLTLVRDADRGDRFAADRGDDVAQGLGHGEPDLGRVVLDPSGSREVLGELAVRERTGPAVPVDRDRTHAGCPRVDGEHDRHVQCRLLALSIRAQRAAGGMVAETELEHDATPVACHDAYLIHREEGARPFEGEVVDELGEHRLVLAAPAGSPLEHEEPAVGEREHVEVAPGEQEGSAPDACRPRGRRAEQLLVDVEPG